MVVSAAVLLFLSRAFCRQLIWIAEWSEVKITNPVSSRRKPGSCDTGYA